MNFYQATFSDRIRLGFAVTLLVAILIAIASFLSIESVRRTANAVAYNYFDDMVSTREMITIFEAASASGRAYLLTGNEEFLARRKDELRRFDQLRHSLGADARSAEGGQRMARLESNVDLFEELSRQTDNLKRQNAPTDEIVAKFDQYAGLRMQIDQDLQRMARHQQQVYVKARDDASRAGLRSLMLFLLLAAVAIVMAGVLAFVLTRTLSDLFRRTQESEASKTRAIQARDEMTAIVSHELKNPLTSVITNIELLRRTVPHGHARTEKDQKTDHALDRIQNSAIRMNRLISDLLDIAKLEAGKLTIETAPVETKTLVSEAVDLFRQQALNQEIRIETDVEPLFVNCDRGRIIQVLANLLSNALKFTPAGGLISIRVSRKPNHQVIFKVEDNGAGMTRDELAHLFERFWQAPKTAARGTGLGLSITRGIVERHGGRMWVESQKGIGSAFFFTLNEAEPLARSA